ncbi:hypothetical protein N9V55_03460 [Candidatus Pelagibacter bacterium]|nr:hypothetical protein [Candidatus Pelagibacter bacterium]
MGIKKLLAIIVLGLLFSGNALACGGDFYTGLFDFSKEHKICGKYARSLDVDSFRQTDAYCDCRERLDNKKKYGIEKIFDD